MRQFLFLLFVLGLLGSAPAFAQDGDDAATYRITDVAVDSTSDTAAHARDAAILQAQRMAFAELVLRLGIEGKAPAADDNALANIVQSFEVQSEKIAAMRYIGTMTIQFKPLSTRAFLTKQGARFSDVRSRPYVILPIVVSKGRPVLWEDRTPWRAAWDDGQKMTGLVSVIVPTGDLDDIAVIGSDDAFAMKPEPLQALIKKYQAGGAIIATLNEAQDPNQAARVDVTKIDASGKPSDPVHFTLAPQSDPKTIAAVLTDGVKQVRVEIEKNWRQASKSMKGPTTHLFAVAPIDSLASWNALRAKIVTVTGVAKVETLTVSREGAKIDIEYHGDIPTLQSHMGEQGLSLDQTATGWIMQAKAAQN